MMRRRRFTYAQPAWPQRRRLRLKALLDLGVGQKSEFLDRQIRDHIALQARVDVLEHGICKFLQIVFLEIVEIESVIVEKIAERFVDHQSFRKGAELLRRVGTQGINELRDDIAPEDAILDF